MTSQNLTGFKALALSQPVQEALDFVGYEQPSPIQAESIPHLLAGHDLLGVAQTGTGKTAAFALPLLSNIDMSLSEPQVLVLAPTRELAIQVAEAFKTYARSIKGFHVLPIYGGQTMTTQLKQLKRGAHVVVGTPGRVMDHLRRKTLKLDQLKTVVLDEADEMLRMGFIDDVEWILEHTPEQRQVALFSATMPKPIQKVANKYLRDPKEVKIKSETTTVERIEQHYWTVSGINKLDALTRMLEVEEFDGIIIFVRTKTATVELADKLEARGYSAAAINGDMSQQLRERTIDNLKKSKVDILVATDVAARGIDVSRVSHVINYDIPYDTEAYVHRIGRTGRAGRSGKAILFVIPRERRLLRAIEKATGQTITQMDLPSKEQVNQKRIEQFKTSVQESLKNPELEFFHNLTAELLDECSASPLELAAVLAYLAQKDNPLILKETSKERAPRERDHDDRGGRGRDRDRGRDKGSDRPRRERTSKSDRIKELSDAGVKMQTYRLSVGYNNDVKPGDIVGAIANEADLESKYIGQIEISDHFSTVDLPADMPEDVLAILKKTKIRNTPINLEPQRSKPGRKREDNTGGKRSDKSGKKRGDKPAAKRRKPSSNASKGPENNTDRKPKRKQATRSAEKS